MAPVALLFSLTSMDGIGTEVVQDSIATAPVYHDGTPHSVRIIAEATGAGFNPEAPSGRCSARVRGRRRREEGDSRLATKDQVCCLN
ncbi:hypothetical protein LshimejAT787_0311300 [Lyophyllum shimeji]|uniref:Uncharacterized protein n=1 Tax=Lyophyllum shimeji TaxID=47721 RepID=A0A9P3PJY1_LYOSH|nr:hypothetical protein LshimejAT787_0311300 [Lyophyllum shimeji]